MNLGLLLLSHVVSLTGLTYLWIAIYRTGQTVGTYTLEAILVYYIVLTILRSIISEGVSLGFEASEEINQGVVTNYLLKPFSYPVEQFLKMAGKVTINAAFMVPLAAVLAWFAKDIIQLPTAVSWIQFVGMMLIGMVFYYLIYFISALSSFWLTNGRSAVYAFMLTGSFLNGSLIPLDLFPESLTWLVQYSPFKFLIFVPIQVFLGRIESWTPLLMQAGAWIIILITIIVLLWKLGVRKFEAVGR